MNKIFFTVVLTAALGFFPEPFEKKARAEEDVQGVAVEDLTADPSRFDGARVRLVGFVRMTLAGDVIYPSEEASHDPEKGIWLVIQDQEVLKNRSRYDGYYCLAEGKVNAANKGRMGRSVAALEEIRTFERWG